MIASLRGRILTKKEKYIILETNDGVGYKIKISQNFLMTLNNEAEIQLFIYSHIREDSFDLFGFQNLNELEFFETLISVKGIGPKIGLEIINFDSSIIKKAIIEKDASTISQIPGIGKKSAERLILELKEKINIDDISIIEASPISNKEESEDIIFALVNLGFNRAQVINGLSKMPKEIKSEEDKIRYFLQNK